MRLATFLATAAILTASAGLAQTTPTPDRAGQATSPSPTQTTPPTAPDDAATTPDAAEAPAAPAPAGSATTPATAAPAATVATNATTLVQPAVGVTVFDPAGTKVGTIKAMEGGFATLTTAKGEVRLATSSIGPGPNGAVIGGTAAQIEAAAKPATPAPAATPARSGRRR